MKTEFTAENFEKLTIDCLDSFKNLKNAKQKIRTLEKPLKTKLMTVQETIDYDQKLTAYQAEYKLLLSIERDLESVYNKCHSALFDFIPDYNQWFILDSLKYAVGIINSSDGHWQRIELIITDEVNNIRELNYDSYRSFADGNLLRHE